LFTYSINFIGSSIFPSTATGIPFSNLISMYVGLSGKFFVFTQMKASSGG
jgi:hypothetical protein